jgi:hypothetical protein
MNSAAKQLEDENRRQYEALSCLNDEVMSMLHAHSLRQPLIDSEHVVDWLRFIYDEVQVGLGEPRHFEKD